MVTRNSGTYIPTGYESLQDDITRRQDLADSYQAKALEAPQGQQSYISPLVAIAEVLAANHIRQSAQRKTEVLNQARRDDNNNIFNALQAVNNPQTATGASAGTSMGLPSDYQGQAPQDARRLLATSNNPLAQGYQKSIAEALAEKSKNQNDYGAPMVVIDQATGQHRTIRTNKAGGQQDQQYNLPPTLSDINGIATDLQGMTPGAALPQDLSKPFTQTGMPNLPVQKYEMGKAGAGAARTSNQTFINTGEKSYATQFGGKLADMDITKLDAAVGAPGRYQEAGRVLGLLKTVPITGTLADWRLATTKALSTAGVIDGKQVTNTEDLSSLLAAQTLEAIKSSGLGTGNGFTDKDRQFLQDAKSGSINMNPQTIGYLARLNQRAAEQSQVNAKNVYRRLKSNPSTAAFADQVGEDINAPLSGAPTRQLSPSDQALLDKYGPRK